MKIVIGNDHTALEVKKEVINYLEKNHGISEIINVGTNENLKSSYPFYAVKAAKTIIEKKADLGIIICGTGVGITVSANKVKGIRAMICRTPLEAKIARECYDINMLGLGSRVQAFGTFSAIIDAFLRTPFTGNKADVDFIDNLLKDKPLKEPEELFKNY